MKCIRCFVLLIALVIGCTACQPKHVHTVDEWTIDTYATCGDNGLQTGVCSSCGETVEEEIPPTGDHSYDKQNPTMCVRCFKVEIDDTATLVDLGNAASATYSVGMTSNCAWDLKLWNGKLYRGAGNYDTNSGKTLVWYFDIAKKQWIPTDVLDDESISRFVEVDGTLMAPGIDPTEGWELGNYYRLNDDGWEKIRKIPGGIHTFDLCELGDKLFFGLGCNGDLSPVCFTTDHENYTSLPLYKNGVPCDTINDSILRAYEFFVFKDALYALISRTNEDGNRYVEFFRYENDKMVYTADVPASIYRSNITYNYFDAKLIYNDTLYIASNYLYYTTDMVNFKQLEMPDNVFVADILVDGKDMYVLCNEEKDDGTFQTILYRTDGASFEKVYSFDYDIPAHAFEKDGNTYYLAMGGKRVSPNIHTGTVLRIAL